MNVLIISSSAAVRRLAARWLTEASNGAEVVWVAADRVKDFSDDAMAAAGLVIFDGYLNAIDTDSRDQIEKRAPRAKTCLIRFDSDVDYGLAADFEVEPGWSVQQTVCDAVAAVPVLFSA